MDYKTHGVCSSMIHVELDGDKIKDVDFVGGCNGNLQGISSLVKGMKVEDAIERLSGIKCGSKATSCPSLVTWNPIFGTAKQSLSKLIQLQSKSHGKGHAAFNSLRVLKLNLLKLTSLDCYNIFSLNCLQFFRPSKALRTNVRAMKYVDCCGRASNCFNIQLLLNF